MHPLTEIPIHRIVAAIMLAFAWFAPGAEAQIERSCGDTAVAARSLPDMLKYFTEGARYDTIRAGKWPKLPPDVPASVVTKPEDCNKIADAVNDGIKEIYARSPSAPSAVR